MSKVFVPSKQNLSGHVTFDSQQTRFFQECNAKTNSVERRRQCGMLTYKPSRNPLLVTEPEPRDEFHGFDFKVPPKKPEPERWTYPENDWGLMAKFNTQKHIYDEIRHKEENYKSLVAEFRAIREKNERIFSEELKREKEKFLAEEIQKNTVTKSPINAVKDPNRVVKSQPNSRGMMFQEDEQLLKQINRAASKQTKDKGALTLHNKQALDHLTSDKHSSYSYLTNAQGSGKLEPLDFFDNKISTIKDLGNTHPDVLAKWRAERAAQFVDKSGQSALQPPPHRATGTKPFHPGGNSIKVVEAMSVPHKTKSKSMSSLHSDNTPSQRQLATMSSNNQVDAATMALNMKALQTALEQTNSEIDRQRLKIALNKKPEKGFQKPKDLTVKTDH